MSPTQGRLARLAATGVLVIALGSPVPVAAQSGIWDSVLSNTNWYVPVPNLIAYISGNKSFTPPPPTPLGDQTLWALGTVTNGVLTGTSSTMLSIGPVVSNNTMSMSGLVTPSGQITIAFTPLDGGLTTVGIGQMRSIDGVPLMEMQMITGGSVLVTHWAYMTPYNPATFTPSSPTQFIPADITSPEWRWTAGTTWRIVSQTLFGASNPGTFKISTYNNGYFWGLGVAPAGSAVGNFTFMGSITPEGNVLFSMLNDQVLTDLTGQIIGPASAGMLLHAYDVSGPFGTGSVAGLMPVSDISAGMTFFASNLGTTVNPVFAGGRLQIDVSGETYPQNFSVDGSGTNTIDQRGNAATFSGLFADAAPGTPGNLIISNSEQGGRITLTGRSTYTGTTTVDAGATLLVDGAIVSPVTVTTNGTLGGTGVVGPTTVRAGGTLAPGDPLGTLTVNGDLALAAGSRYAIAIAGTSASRTAIAGSAALAGTAILLVDPSAGLTNHYQILAAASGRTGTFDALLPLGLPDFMSPSLRYGPGDAELDLTSRLGLLAGLTRNESAVAGALDRAFNDGGQTIAGLFALPTDAIPAALARLSGEGVSATQTVAFDIGDKFLSRMIGQAGLSLASREPDANVGVGSPAIGYAADVPAPGVVKAAPTAPQPRAWRTWAAGFDGTLKLDGEASTGSAGLSARSAGAMAGLDYQITPDLLLGFAAGGTSASFSVPDRSTGGRVDAVDLGAYATARHGSLYAAGALGLAAIDNTTTRSIFVAPAGTATARFHSQLLGARVELGACLPWGQAWGEVAVTPFVAAQLAEMWQPSFTEATTSITAAPGVPGLSYAARSVTSAPLFLGGQIDTRITLANGMVWSPSARLSWVHELSADRAVTASFAALPLSSFTVAGASGARDAARLDLTSTLRIAQNVVLFGSFDGEFSSRSQLYAGKGGIQVTW